MKTKFSEEWEKFRNSEDGKSATNLETLRNLTDPKYLENRLHTAFSAGWNASNSAPDGSYNSAVADIELKIIIEEKWTHPHFGGERNRLTEFTDLLKAQKYYADRIKEDDSNGGYSFTTIKLIEKKATASL